MPNIKLPTGVDLYYETHGQRRTSDFRSFDRLFRRSLEAVADAAGRFFEHGFS